MHGQCLINIASLLQVNQNFHEFYYAWIPVFTFKLHKDWQGEPVKGMIIHRLGYIIQNCQYMTISDFLKCLSHTAHSDLKEHYTRYRKDDGLSDCLLHDLKQLSLSPFPPLQNVDHNACLSGSSEGWNAIMATSCPVTNTQEAILKWLQREGATVVCITCSVGITAEYLGRMWCSWAQPTLRPPQAQD